MAESRQSKGKRIVVFSMLVFFVALLAPAISGSVAQGISNVQTHSLVLQSNDVVDYAYGYISSTNVSKLPIASVDYNTTVTNTHIVEVKNATGALVSQTEEFLTDYLLTNTTIGQMNLHSVNDLNISTNVAVNATAVIGYGTTYSNFVPIASVSYTAKKNTTADFGYAISPAELTGNQSMYLMVEMELSNKSTPATYTIHIATKGVASGLYSYTTGEDVGYVIGGALILIFAFLSIPHYDLSMRSAQNGAVVVGTRKKGGRR